MQSQKRVYLSIALVVAGVALAVFAASSVTTVPPAQAQGMVIDHGYYETEWVGVETTQFETERDLLQYVCDYKGVSVSFDTDGSILELDGLSSTASAFWSIWVVERGDTGWTMLSAPFTQKPSDYTISTVAYTEEGSTPTVGVDYSGAPIYGYSTNYRTVTLSPTVTEIVSSIKATNTIVGVDSYSDYPSDIVNGVSKGSIKVTGTYTSPSFEVIIDLLPDMVFCDGTQRSHYLMAEQLRKVGTDAVVLYPGVDLDSIRDNLFIAGAVMHYDLSAQEVRENMDYVISAMTGLVLTANADRPDVMVALEPDISPWVSGSGTYIDSMLSQFNSNNVFSGWNGWVHLTSDLILQANPDVILVVTTVYRATQSEYDHMYNNLSMQWKNTDAWKNGEVYMICEGASELVQRFGPRTPQAAELICKIIHPECFSDTFPKFVGDDYARFLDISKDMSYD